MYIRLICIDCLGDSIDEDVSIDFDDEGHLESSVDPKSSVRFSTQEIIHPIAGGKQVSHHRQSMVGNSETESTSTSTSQNSGSRKRMRKSHQNKNSSSKTAPPRSLFYNKHPQYFLTSCVL